MKQHIILDRDGVINVESRQYIKTVDEWIPLPGSLEAIAKLHQAGFVISVATNQSGLTRGLFDEAILSDIHTKMLNTVDAAGGKIDSVFYCPHHPDDRCECRKPKPGLLKQIAKHYEIDLKNVMMVGDSLRDLQAGVSAGAKPVLVKTGNGGEQLAKVKASIDDVLVFDDLMELVRYVVE